MQPPPVQYVKTKDGLSTAYAVSGKGKPLVFMPGAYDHLQLAWQYPSLHLWLEGLVTRFQLLQHDPRGFGMSSRGLSPEHCADDCLLDVEAVVDRLQLERFILFGTGPLAAVAAHYAVKHPDRVSALILEAARIKESRPAVYEAVVLQDWDWFLNTLMPQDRSADESRRTVDLMKQAWEPDNLSLRMRAFAAEDCRALYESVRVPTLVLHPRAYVLNDVMDSREAAKLCGGRMVLIEGNTQWGDAPQGIQAIEDFLAEVLPAETPAVAQHESLSERECDVLRLIAAGRSSREIGEALVLSVRTVERHIANIYLKTGTHGRAQVTAYALGRGIV